MAAALVAFAVAWFAIGATIGVVDGRISASEAPAFAVAGGFYLATITTLIPWLAMVLGLGLDAMEESFRVGIYKSMALNTIDGIQAVVNEPLAIIPNTVQKWTAVIAEKDGASRFALLVQWALSAAMSLLTTMVAASWLSALGGPSR
ncbi:MAG: hypothetical protein AAF531_15735 [Actinomycetota bacterium]